METKELFINSLLSKDKELLNEILDEIYPIDTAILLEEIDDDLLLVFCQMVDKKQIAEVIEQSEITLQKRILEHFNMSDVIEIFSYMSNDDITDIIGELPFQLRKDILRYMNKSESNEIEQLLGYAPDTAGGIMTTEYLALKGDLTVQEAVFKIKKIGPKTEVLDVIFVLDNNKKLVGTVGLRDILTADESNKLYDIMNENVIFTHPDEPQEVVSQLVSKYDLTVIPVINRRDSLLGIITVDDIIDVIVEEHTEDLLGLGGVSKEERVHSPLSDSVKKRLPWLVVNLATAFLGSLVIANFEDTIAQVVALAAIMPVIAALGGNSGSQSLSVVIRAITLGELDIKEDWRLLSKQLSIGLITGLAVGSTAGLIIFFRYQNIFLSLIALLAMIGSLVIGSIFGFLIPVILKSLGIDPALASSIFLTAITDVSGFFVFLGLARLFMPLLQ
ncbi:MAG: magnesium transporter [Clostridiales bacterium]|nr:magnesium transporter [Clostridiales bacterium]